MTDLDYAAKISSCGIRPSIQRIAVYKYVAENRNHPTVDTVYQSLHPIYPTLSRTTIYNTLHLFCSAKLIQTVGIEEAELRYDANITPHIHFKCSICGKIFDIMPKTDKTNETYSAENSTEIEKFLPQGFKAERSEINLWGTCPDCANR